MRALTQREKRTVKLGAIALAAYLVLLYGLKGVRALEDWRGEYDRVRVACEAAELEMLREQVKAQRLAKLKEVYRFDPTKLRADTLVGEVRAAIQQSAQAIGVQLGPSKESPGRSDGKEIAVLQIEGTGLTPAAVRFIQSLGTLGYPLAIDWVTWKTGGLQPGQVRISLGVAVLSYTPAQSPNTAGKEPVRG
jgi:hypothetical protein